MAKKLTLKNYLQEIHLFQNRSIMALIIVAALLLVLLVRLLYLQIMQHQVYTSLSDKNQFTVMAIPPKRGIIYDRHHKIIAQNIPVYNLMIIPEKVKDLDDTIENLQNFITITDEQIQRFYKTKKQRRRFQAVPLRFKLNDDELARFYVNQHGFPGVNVEASLMRYYPQGQDTVDVLGYVGRINARELNRINSSNYTGTNYIGKVGIERYYEKLLHGQVGSQQVETDASGRVLRVIDKTPPIPGTNITLTIDSDLQHTAREALGKYRGAVVAIDPNNGEILAMVNNPNYQPNLFVQGMTNKQFQALQQDSAQPLFNRAIRGQYPMASIIKPFLGVHALEQHIITGRDAIRDHGYFQIENTKHRYRDWTAAGHGWVNLHKAIVVSCNTFFYDLSLKLGISNIESIMRQFAFGDYTGVDMKEELPGLIPTPDWKRGQMGEAWYLGDTVLSGIGHGYMLSTPLQNATATMGLANRGTLYRPHLLKSQQLGEQAAIDTVVEQLPGINAAPQHWQYVINAMQGVINEKQGTGFRFGKAPYTVAAKTGTGQVISNVDRKKYKSGKIAAHLKDNSIFIAFAPVDKPKIAVAVIVENDLYAPNVARKVMDKYLLEDIDVNS